MRKSLGQTAAVAAGPYGHMIPPERWQQIAVAVADDITSHMEATFDSLQCVMPRAVLAAIRERKGD